MSDEGLTDRAQFALHFLRPFVLPAS
jgi:hypothetical protein